MVPRPSAVATARVLAPGGVEADRNEMVEESVESRADESPEGVSDRVADIRSAELQILDEIGAEA